MKRKTKENVKLYVMYFLVFDLCFAGEYRCYFGVGEYICFEAILDEANHDFARVELWHNHHVRQAYKLPRVATCPTYMGRVMSNGLCENLLDGCALVSCKRVEIAKCHLIDHLYSPSYVK